MVRNGGTNTAGWMQTYGIDMNTCLPTSQSEITDFHSQSHEFFLWHDPANANRVLVYMAIWTAGLPDPEHAGLYIPDMIVMAGSHDHAHHMRPSPPTLPGRHLTSAPPLPRPAG